MKLKKKFRKQLKMRSHLKYKVLKKIIKKQVLHW